MADRSALSFADTGPAGFLSASRWTGILVGDVMSSTVPWAKANPVMAPQVLRLTSAVACCQAGFLTDCTESPSIAVGTALAGGPPRRSQRAELPHWAPASGTNAKAHVREGMHHAGVRQPPIRQAVHAFPVQAGALATAPQRLVPLPRHPGAGRRHRLSGARHRV